jgi:hypothetical protein
MQLQSAHLPLGAAIDFLDGVAAFRIHAQERDEPIGV